MKNNLFGGIQNMVKGKFMATVESGNKLTYDELRQLNTVWKDDYMKHIIGESDQMQLYVQNWIKKAQDGGNEVAAV